MAEPSQRFDIRFTTSKNNWRISTTHCSSRMTIFSGIVPLSTLDLVCVSVCVCLSVCLSTTILALGSLVAPTLRSGRLQLGTPRHSTTRIVIRRILLYRLPVRWRVTKVAEKVRVFLHKLLGSFGLMNYAVSSPLRIVHRSNSQINVIGISDLSSI